MCDGNLHALNEHLAQQEDEDSLNQAVESKQHEIATELLDDMIEHGVAEDETPLDILCESDEFNEWVVSKLKTDDKLKEILFERLKPSFDEAKALVDKEWEDDYYDCDL